MTPTVPRGAHWRLVGAHHDGDPNWAAYLREPSAGFDSRALRFAIGDLKARIERAKGKSRQIESRKHPGGARDDARAGATLRVDDCVGR